MNVADFWGSVDRSGGEGACWPWLRAKNRGGYGRVRFANKDTRAHRVALLLTAGEPPAGTVANHACHRRECCNPRHLSWDSQAKNIRDAYAVGSKRRPTAFSHVPEHRMPRGESHGMRKLTTDGVVQIRSRAASGEAVKALAEEFGVTIQNVYLIVKRRAWRHV